MLRGPRGVTLIVGVGLWGIFNTIGSFDHYLLVEVMCHIWAASLASWQAELSDTEPDTNREGYKDQAQGPAATFLDYMWRNSGVGVRQCSL